MIYACATSGCVCVFPGVFLSSRVTGACPVTTDLIMRVNVRATTTTRGCTFCAKKAPWAVEFLVCKELRGVIEAISRKSTLCFLRARAYKKLGQS